MEFGFTEGQENFRQCIINYCNTELPPMPVSPAGIPSYIGEKIGRISGRGWFDLCIPEEYGSIEGTPIDRVIYLKK